GADYTQSARRKRPGESRARAPAHLQPIGRCGTLCPRPTARLAGPSSVAQTRAMLPEAHAPRRGPPQELTRRECLMVAGAALASLPMQRTARATSGTATPGPAGKAGTLTLGNDLTVNRMGFGAMRITGAGIWGEPPDPAGARRVLSRAVELGVQLIDTADAYGPEVSEQLIYEALHPYRQDVVIATKGGLTRPVAGRWDHDASPEHLRVACEASLARLHLERIALYQLHAPDPKIPFEDS